MRMLSPPMEQDHYLSQIFLSLNIVCRNSDGSGETSQLRSLVWSLVANHATTNDIHSLISVLYQNIFTSLCSGRLSKYTRRNNDDLLSILKSVSDNINVMLF